MGSSQIVRRFSKALFGKPCDVDVGALKSGQNILPVLSELVGDPIAQVDLDRRASLQIGVDSAQWCQSELSLDEFLFWCPVGLPRFNGTAIVSSRLGKKLHEMQKLADSIRTIVSRVEHDERIVTGCGTTLDQPVRRACHWFDVPVVSIEKIPKNPATKWIWESNSKKPDQVLPVYFSPMMPVLDQPADSQNWTDDLMFALARDVHVLYVRPKGTIFRLASNRLQTNLGDDRKTYLLIGDSLPDAIAKQQLISQGGIGWLLLNSTDATHQTGNQSSPVAGAPVHDAPIWSIDEINPQEFLCHYTRTRQQQWPDQTQSSQWDQYLFGRECEFGPLASLCRILSKQRLFASGQLIRGGYRVACFTEIPLDRLGDHRQFRSHLSRWDFEPFGIAIKRASLQDQYHAQPVTYGDEETWRRLRDDQRPYFQLTGDNPGGETTDWSQEREWRVEGDIDLRRFSTDEAIVFVPDEFAARRVAPISRWPIVVLERAAETAENQRLPYC